jgi:hypothetical protein
MLTQLAVAEQMACSMLCDDIPYALLATPKYLNSAVASFFSFLSSLYQNTFVPLCPHLIKRKAI